MLILRLFERVDLRVETLLASADSGIPHAHWFFLLTVEMSNWLSIPDTRAVCLTLICLTSFLNRKWGVFVIAECRRESQEKRSLLN